MIHTTVTHAKFQLLKLRLRLPKWQIVGLLQTLWNETMGSAREGDIGKYSNQQIADLLEYSGCADSLIDALCDCRWLDRHPVRRIVVHNWERHAPNFVKGQNRKLQISRELSGSILGPGPRDPVSGPCPIDNDPETGHTKPNQTKPNQTKQNIPPLPPGGEVSGAGAQDPVPGKNETETETEKKTVDPKTVAADLAGEWCFYHQGKRETREHAMGIFSEAVRLGFDPGKLSEKICGPERDRSEYLWQFKSREMEQAKPAAAPAKNKKQEDEVRLSGLMSRTYGDKK